MFSSTHQSLHLPVSFSVCLSLSSFSSSRSTVRRLLRRISHDCPTVILRDPLRSIQVSLSASIYVIACLLFRTALTNREGWWILIAGALACSFSISFSSVFCNILMTLRSAGCPCWHSRGCANRSRLYYISSVIVIFNLSYLCYVLPSWLLSSIDIRLQLSWI